MSREAEKSLAAFSWGAGILGLLILGYGAILTQVAPKAETGVRVIPWQAPDLEIQSSAPPVTPAEPANN